MKKSNLKSFVAGMLIGSMIFSGVTIAFAANYSETLNAVYRDIKVYVNGNRIDYVASNGAYSEPFIVNGTTYVPLRLFSEKTGFDVMWDGNTSSIYVYDTGNNPSLGEVDASSAIELAYSYGCDNLYPQESGYRYAMDKSSGSVVQESNAGFVVSFRVDMIVISSNQREGHWNNYYWVDKNGGVNYLTEADQWNSRWINMETGDLTDYYWDFFN